MILLGLGLALAGAPERPPEPGLARAGRGPLPRPTAVYWEEGRRPDAAIVKFRDDAGIRVQDGEIVGVDAALRARLGGATLRPHLALGGWKWSLPPSGEGGRRPDEGVVATEIPLGAHPLRPDLSTYTRLITPDAEVIATLLLDDPRVESAWLAPLPVPPPEDIPPITPDFLEEMHWRGAEGLGFDEAARWPGGRGENVQIADIEYAWDADHEDLDGLVPPMVWGWPSGEYAYHGTMVLGMLSAGDNGYGMIGALPDAAAMVLSPFDEERWYDVGAAVLASIELLGPGDVLLIEQQGFRNGTYCPVSAEPDIFDAIRAATDAGIVVVEPGGNGAADLDGPVWEGWFDRATQDSGSILVGGGAPPGGDEPARAWYGDGSSYGARVDVQGWFDLVATLANGESGGYFADLYFPDRDGRQAYTTFFSGTSAASPMVAAAAAVLQSVALAIEGAPLRPEEVRALLVSTGSPQVGGPEHIGPQPDVPRLLRAAFR